MANRCSRRSFLKGLGYATCGGLVHTVGSPLISPLRAISAEAAQPGKVIVLVNFRGGFPLNIVPLTHGYWIDRFEELAHPGTALPLADGTALHPSLTALKQIWDEGNLAIAHNCGYYNPAKGVRVNRSHSDSTDIFFSGRPDVSTPTEGWAVRFTNQVAKTYGGVSFGGSNFLVENANFIRNFGDLNNLGEQYFRRGGSSSTQEEFYRTIRDQLQATTEKGAVNNVGFIRAANENLDATLELLKVQTDPQANPLPDESLFGNSGFSNQCRDAARIINAPVLDTQFLYVEQGGYDTHSGELANLTNRLDDWNEGIGALYENVRQMGRLADVIFVTMADFGRTTFMNGSGGTDHGHSSPWLMFGGAISGGIKTPAPTLAELTSGGSWIRDVHVQFPSLLRQIVEGIGFNGEQIFPGYSATNLPLFR